MLFVLAVLWRTRDHKRRWLPAAASVCVVGVLSSGCMLLGSQRQATTPSRILYFHQGIGAGPTFITDANGNVFEERSYEPFGEDLEAYREHADGTAAVGPVDFEAEAHNSLNKQTDPATGWSYHGARWMAPESARWLTPDPPVKAPDPKFMAAPWAMHPYQYVQQNPVMYWDPDGREERITGHISFQDEPVVCEPVGATCSIVSNDTTASAPASDMSASAADEPRFEDTAAASAPEFAHWLPYVGPGLGAVEALHGIRAARQQNNGWALLMQITALTVNVTGLFLDFVTLSLSTTLRNLVLSEARNGISRTVQPRVGVARGRPPGPTIDRTTGSEIGRFVVDPKGNTLIEPTGGSTVGAGRALRGGVRQDTHTTYPNGSTYQRLNASGHPNNPTPHGHGHAQGTGPGQQGQGQALDVYGNPVRRNSAAAHWDAQ